MQKKYFIGVDVSKHTLDIAFIIHQPSCFSKPVWMQFANTQQGLIQMKQWLTEKHIPLSD